MSETDDYQLMHESIAASELARARALLKANQLEAGTELLTVLAKQNNPEAQFELGTILLMVATDSNQIEQGMVHLREAEQHGYSPAIYRLAYTSLVESAERLDWSVLAARWRICCQRNHAQALCDAAVYFRRFGNNEQQQISTDMLEYAALQGSIVAMALLGERLALGDCCKANPARANSIRKLAIQMGMPVPSPNPAFGFASPEPDHIPQLTIHWNFDDIEQATKASHGECLDKHSGLYCYKQLLSAEECLYIQCFGGPDVEPSISVDDHGRQHLNQTRTSWDFSFLPEHEQIYLNLLQRRMAAAGGLPLNTSESMIILRYLPGQEYKLHRDVLPASHFIPVSAGGAGQRRRTVITYLNTPEQGGETSFPLMQKTIPALQGQTVCFDNILPDQQTIRTSLHAGLPVIQGVKWICTLWMREQTHRAL